MSNEQEDVSTDVAPKEEVEVEVEENEDGEEEEEEEEEEESIESEPILSYARMKNDVLGILNDDSVSCIRAGSKIIVLGTHWGRVHILTHEGIITMTKENVII